MTYMFAQDTYAVEIWAAGRLRARIESTGADLLRKCRAVWPRHKTGVISATAFASLDSGSVVVAIMTDAGWV